MRSLSEPAGKNELTDFTIASPKFEVSEPFFACQEVLTIRPQALSDLPCTDVALYEKQTGGCLQYDGVDGCLPGSHELPEAQYAPTFVDPGAFSIHAFKLFYVVAQ